VVNIARFNTVSEDDKKQLRQQRFNTQGSKSETERKSDKHQKRADRYVRIVHSDNTELIDSL